MEGLAYARNGNKVRLHYTVSPAHLDLFRAAVADRVARISKAEGVEIEITYSFQKPSTDTVAATMDNEPFRDADGRLMALLSRTLTTSKPTLSSSRTSTMWLRSTCWPPRPNTRKCWPAMP